MISGADAGCLAHRPRRLGTTGALPQAPHCNDLLSLTARTAGPHVALEELSLQHDAVLARDYLARQQPGNNLRRRAVLHTGPHASYMKNLRRIRLHEVLVSYKHDVAGPVPMDRVARNHNRLGLFAQHNPSGAKGVGPQP